MASASDANAMVRSLSPLDARVRAGYRYFRRLLREVEQHDQVVLYGDDDLHRLRIQLSTLSLETEAETDAEYFRPLPAEHPAVRGRPHEIWSDYAPHEDEDYGKISEESFMSCYNHDFVRGVCNSIGNDLMDYDHVTFYPPIRSTSWVAKSLSKMPFGGLADFGFPGPRRSQWMVAVAFDTRGTIPHISCVMSHEAEGTDTTITRGELSAICEIQKARMKQIRLQKNKIFPVLILSILTPGVARFLQAHYDVEMGCLKLRRSKCYNVQTTKHIDLLLRWVAAEAVGDTTLEKTSNRPAIAMETTPEPEVNLPESTRCLIAMASANPENSGEEIRPPLNELRNPQAIWYPKASADAKIESLPKRSTPSKVSSARARKTSRMTKTFRTPLKTTVYHVREPRRRYSDTDLSKVCF